MFWLCTFPLRQNVIGRINPGVYLLGLLNRQSLTIERLKHLMQCKFQGKLNG